MRLRVIDHFDAAHRLLQYQGKCANLHGHTWVVEVGIDIDIRQITSVGFAIDFGDLKLIVKSVLEEYDHAFLVNRSDPISANMGFTRLIQFDGNPTAEMLAIQILKDLRQELRERELTGITVAEVTVWESPRAGVTVYNQEVAE
jgi:6-pyruvoyltetrahydropterin/6-carboxytetrahydropterin synthase